MSNFILPQWPAPARVMALVTTRAGGTSGGPWTSLNLGDHVGDSPAQVAENRRLLRKHLPSDPVWLSQLHGTGCVDAAEAKAGAKADASFCRKPGIVCAVLTADCLPVLLCDEAATVVGAVHAGWRGLAAGVIESAVTAMAVPGSTLMAWLGPAIGPKVFEVGPEVRSAFVTHDIQAASAFVPGSKGKWYCDIHTLAHRRLNKLGICRVASADFCTAQDTERFYSYRRERITGRMASCIWLE